MRKFFERILALTLSLMLVFSAAPVTVLAEGAETPLGANGEITAFGGYEPAVTVPSGTEEADLPLPPALTATVEDGEGEPESVSLPVTWAPDEAYAGEAGEYSFTAAVGESYTLATDLAAPVITVTVEGDAGTESEEPGVEEPQGGETPAAVLTITAFAPLDPMSYEYTAGEAPKTQDELPLPGTLTATVEDGEGEPEERSLPVTWETDKPYDGAPGEYSFTAEAGEGYTLAADVTAPVITVTVEDEVLPEVLITIAEGENGSALYLDAGAAVTNDDLLEGVTAADEKGEAVEVTVAGIDGLDMDDPRPRTEGDAETGLTPKPYTLTYEAKHPVTEEVFTVTRECFVTGGIMGLAATGDFAGLKTAAASDGTYTLSGDISTDEVYEAGGYVAGLVVENNLMLDLNGHNLDITVDSGNGIKIASGVTLTVQDSAGTGTLTVINEIPFSAENRYLSAGIDVSDGYLVIESGTVNATGSVYGVGIGGGWESASGNIIINGGNVTATGGPNGAGIGGGGGFDGDGGNITINGGNVTATGTIGGAGIGGGRGNGGTISISGGTVHATGGDNDPGLTGGTGIGGGPLSEKGGNITISGGNVTATGGSQAAGIGGSHISTSGSVTISGGTVKAVKGGGAEFDIGNTIGQDATIDVKITGGSVNATTVSLPTNDGNTRVYLNTLTLGASPVGDNLPVTAVSYDGITNYGLNDVATTDGGNIYVWLPENQSSRAFVGATAGVNRYGKYWFRDTNAQTQTLLLDSAETQELTVAQTDGTGGFTYEFGVVTITADGEYIISNKKPAETTHRIAVANEVRADIILDGVNINVSGYLNYSALDLSLASDSPNATTVTLAEDSDNTLKSGSNAAGIQLPDNKQVNHKGNRRP